MGSSYTFIAHSDVGGITIMLLGHHAFSTYGMGGRLEGVGITPSVRGEGEGILSCSLITNEVTLSLDVCFYYLRGILEGVTCTGDGG